MFIKLGWARWSQPSRTATGLALFADQTTTVLPSILALASTNFLSAPAMVNQLSGYQSAKPLDLGAGVWAYRFATPRGDVYVVWAKESTTVRLPLAVAQVTVTDVSGGTTTADPAVLPVGASPIFISS